MDCDKQRNVDDFSAYDDQFAGCASASAGVRNWQNWILSATRAVDLYYHVMGGMGGAATAAIRPS